MAPALQQSTLYCTQADVQALLSVDGVNLRLADEDDSATPTTAESNYLLVNILNYATARVNFYCENAGYNAADLVTSWLVNEWATVIAAHRLCLRRGNPVPDTLKEMYKEAIADMDSIRAGTFQIPDIGKRQVGGPTFSNLVVRPEYQYRKARVERPISDKSATSYQQQVDWTTQNTIEI